MTKQNKKKIFSIPVEWAVYSKIEVEAETLEEALNKVRFEDLPLPAESDYIDGTFKIYGEDDFSDDEDLGEFLKGIFNLTPYDDAEAGDVDTIRKIREHYRKYLNILDDAAKKDHSKEIYQVNANQGYVLMQWCEQNFINKGEELRNLLAMEDNIFVLMNKAFRYYDVDYLNPDEIVECMEDLIDDWTH